MTRQIIYPKIAAIAGDWYVIGQPEGNHYIDALNLDTDGMLLKKVIVAYVTLRQNFLQHLKTDKNHAFSIDDGYFVLKGLQSNLYSDVENLLQASIFTCSLMEDQANFFYEDFKRISMSTTGETKSLAILAIGSTSNKSEELVDFLLENTMSSEWYIRGNSIRTLGRLRLSPEKAIPVVVSALQDNQGHDWTVRECAIQALMDYADINLIDNASVVLILKSLRKKLKQEQMQGWVDQIKVLNALLHKISKT